MRTMEIRWADVEGQMQSRIQKAVQDADTKVKSCAVRSANELRNAALNVLRGERGGRTYRVPGSKRSYVASAPGEPPAVRTGMLRMSWGMSAEGDGNGHYSAGIYTDVPYAKPLEEGTSRTARRPYRSRIIEMAKPGVRRIFAAISTERT